MDKTTRPPEELADGTPLTERVQRERGFWTAWVGNFDGSDPVMLISRKFSIPWTQYVVEFHKFCARDAEGCYHTHPYNAWRIILWGGYVEEVIETFTHGDWSVSRLPGSRFHCRRVGHIGRVTHGFCHRVDRLIGNVSYSLWIHGPKTHDVHLVGDGWKN